jgi:hypothetical protein
MMKADDLDRWMTRWGLILLAFGIFDEISLIKNIGFGLIVGSVVVVLIDKLARTRGDRPSSSNKSNMKHDDLL